MATITISYQSLSAFVNKLLAAAGMPPALVPTATRNLLLADLRGVDSHGVARLSGYIRLVDAGRIDLNAIGQIEREAFSTALYDGQKGMGHVIAEEAMNIAIQKASQTGAAWVAVKNSNHFGLAGTYAIQAAERGFIGFSFTNASPLVAPAGGKERLLGTNPIAVAVPTGQQPMFVLDMATTTAANGKLEVLQRKGYPAPAGWIQDQEGKPTTDANAVKLGGALLPLGGTTDGASHKGYGLGAVVDILSGVLSGAGFGPWVPPFVAFLPMPADPVGDGIGHFFGAVKIDAFMPEAEFRSRMDIWIERVRNSQSLTEAPVLVPGDPERIIAEDRLVNGIPLLNAVWQDLAALAERYQITLPEVNW